MEEKDNGTRNKVLNTERTLNSGQFAERVDFEKLTPEEKDIVRTAGGCMAENILLSLTTGYVAYRQTGKYIVTRGTPTMKSWGSVLAFTAGFAVFSSVRRMYSQAVCTPRIKKLPPSPMRDRFLKEVAPQFMPQDEYNNSKGVPSSIPHTTIYPEKVMKEAEKVEGEEEHKGNMAHATDNSVKSSDADKNTHWSHKGRDFDYSKSYKLPPAEVPLKAVRRNKYGDIIEDA